MGTTKAQRLVAQILLGEPRTPLPPAVAQQLELLDASRTAKSPLRDLHGARAGA